MTRGQNDLDKSYQQIANEENTRLKASDGMRPDSDEPMGRRQVIEQAKQMLEQQMQESGIEYDTEEYWQTHDGMAQQVIGALGVPYQDLTPEEQANLLGTSTDALNTIHQGNASNKGSYAVQQDRSNLRTGAQ